MLSKAVAKQMIKQGGGRIINVTSIGGVRPGADGLGAYCTSKAALNMMTQVMARELAQYNILVNAIAPGSIKTEMSRANWSDPERAKRRVEDIELKRFGDPQEIAGLALYLASPASSFMTGEIICVDGGQTL
jgi:NAD(P)-dependent dehydrogenase (short-subunit alcohol dehydrogenase family)